MKRIGHIVSTIFNEFYIRPVFVYKQRYIALDRKLKNVNWFCKIDPKVLYGTSEIFSDSFNKQQIFFKPTKVLIKPGALNKNSLIFKCYYTYCKSM